MDPEPAASSDPDASGDPSLTDARVSPGPAPADAGPSTTGLRPGPAFLLYGAARLALLAVVLGVLWLLGLRGLPLVMVALLVAGPIAFLLLGRLGVPAGQGLTGAVRSLNDRLDERARAEDGDED